LLFAVPSRSLADCFGWPSGGVGFGLSVMAASRS